MLTSNLLISVTVWQPEVAEAIGGIALCAVGETVC